MNSYVKRDKKGRFIKGNTVNLGRKRTKEACDKISLSQKKRFTSQRERDKISKQVKIALKNPIIREKMRLMAKKRANSEINLGKYALCGKRLDLQGDNHWNWRGGRTNKRTKIWHSEKYQEWRKNIYKRDGYKCQKCGDDSGNNLIPHHIDSFADYPKLRFKITNGIVLCKNCHTYFHSKYGTHHNNKKQLKEFLNEEQKSIITKRGRQVMVQNIS